MPLIERYRKLYAHEADANDKMLDMIESVPPANRGDARFRRALSLAAHLAACRENFLEFMTGATEPRGPWREEYVELSGLRPRYAALQRAWTAYLAGLGESDLARDFTLHDNGSQWSYAKEIQLEQLAEHATYHRGQIALLVDQLGGTVVDTDYVDWALMSE